MSRTCRVLASIANQRFGVVNSKLARRHGISNRTLSEEVERGRLKRLHRSVYLYGVGPFCERTRWRAALDACGESAALTLWSGARLWGIADARDEVIDIATPTNRRNRPGIRIHRSVRLSEEDVVEIDGLRVLRIERLIMELADVCTVGRLCRIMDKALHRGLLDIDLLEDLAGQMQTRRGAARIRFAISMLVDGSTGTRSAFEEGTIDRVVSVPGVPRLICTRVDILGLSLEPDIHFPTLFLMVEIDDPTHDKPVKRRSDRSNDRRLESAGITVCRIHWSDVERGLAATNTEIVHRCIEQQVQVPAAIRRRWAPGPRP